MTERAGVEQLVNDLTAVIRDAESLLRATASHTSDTVTEARSQAEQTVRQAKARLALVEEEALARARALAGDADDYVRKNPWTAVGVAAAAGLLLGLFMSRR